MSKAKPINTNLPKILGELGNEIDRAMTRAENQARLASTPKARPRSARRRGFALAATAVVVGLVAVAAIFADPFSNRGPVRALSVDEAVAKVAGGAFATPHATSTGYLNTTSRQTTTSYFPAFGGASKKDDFAFTYAVERTTWQASNRTGWTDSRLVSTAFPSTQDRSAAQRQIAAMDRQRAKYDPGHSKSSGDFFAVQRAAIEGKPVDRTSTVCKINPSIANYMFGSETLTLRGVQKPASTDPKKLYRQLLAVVKGLPARYRPESAWNRVEGSLQTGAVKLKPAQRAALVKVLALIPGVTTIPGSTDPNGNPAIGFKRTTENRVEQIFLDPRTALLTYSDAVNSGPKGSRPFGSPPGSVLSRYELIGFKYVQNLPAGIKASQNETNVLFVGGCPYSGPKGHYLRTRTR